MKYEDMKKLVMGKMEFTSISLLPDEVKYELHLLLDANKTPAEMIDGLKAKFGSTAPIPDYKELAEYRKLYKSLKESFNFEDVKSVLSRYFPNFTNLIDNVTLHSVYSFKEVLLKEMVVKCITRMRRVENSTTDKVVPAQERVIMDYISEIRDLMELLSKLENNAIQDKTYIVNIISTEIQPLLEAVQQTVNEVCPDKSESFKEAFKERAKRALYKFNVGGRLLTEDTMSSSLVEMEAAKSAMDNLKSDSLKEAVTTDTVPVSDLPYSMQLEVLKGQEPPVEVLEKQEEKAPE